MIKEPLLDAGEAGGRGSSLKRVLLLHGGSQVALLFPGANLQLFTLFPGVVGFTVPDALECLRIVDFKSPARQEKPSKIKWRSPPIPHLHSPK